jgi:hypothetical protein
VGNNLPEGTNGRHFLQHFGNALSIALVHRNFVWVIVGPSEEEFHGHDLEVSRVTYSGRKRKRFSDQIRR